tara:strand:+ start:805 stop:1329 length:525 start_codon:yes stop_codon:yes gene_type:complete
MADGYTAYTPWIRSRGGETGKRPMWFAHHGGGSNSSHNQGDSTFKINLTASPDVDRTSDFDESNSRFVVPISGFYYVMYNVCIQHAGNRATEDIGISIRKNNNVIVNYEDHSANSRNDRTLFTNMCGCAIFLCAENDQIELYCTPYNGYDVGDSSAFTIGTGARTNMTGFLLGY